jgi:hypothetical protein
MAKSGELTRGPNRGVSSETDVQNWQPWATENALDGRHPVPEIESGTNRVVEPARHEVGIDAAFEVDAGLAHDLPDAVAVHLRHILPEVSLWRPTAQIPLIARTHRVSPAL